MAFLVSGVVFILIGWMLIRGGSFGRAPAPGNREPGSVRGEEGRFIRQT
jgi:hypothetical protein